MNIIDFIGYKSRLWVFIGIIIGAGLAIIEIGFSIYIAYILSILGVLETDSTLIKYLPRGDDIYIGLAGFVLLGVIRATFHTLKSLSAVASSEFFITRLKDLTIRKLLYTEHLHISSHEVSSLFSEIYSRAALCLLAITNAIPLVIQAIVISIFLFNISATFTFIGLIYLFFAAAISLLIQKKVHPIVQPMVELNNELYKSISRVVKNWFLIKIMSVEEVEIERLEETLFSYTSKKMVSTIFASLAEGLPMILGVIMISLFILLQFEFNFLESAVFVSFLYLFLRFVQVVGQISNFISTAHALMPDFKYANEYFQKIEVSNIPLVETKLNSYNFFRESCSIQIKHEINKNLTRSLTEAPEVKVENLSFKHAGANKNLFSELSFLVKSGEQVGIIGPSGVGKSTLLSILLGMFKTESGNVSIASLSTESFMDIHRHSVSYAGADPYLFDGTLRDNLLYGNSRPIKDSDIRKCLYLIGLEDWMNSGMVSLDYSIKEDKSQISTGQKQRISIARAFLRQPKLLILDEVTSNVDYKTEKMITDLLRQLKGDVTVIIVTHRTALIKYADTVIDLTKDV